MYAKNIFQLESKVFERFDGAPRGLVSHRIGMTPRQDFKSNLHKTQWGWDFFSFTHMVSTDQKNVSRMGI